MFYENKHVTALASGKNSKLFAGYLQQYSRNRLLAASAGNRLHRENNHLLERAKCNIVGSADVLRIEEIGGVPEHSLSLNAARK